MEQGRDDTAAVALVAATIIVLVVVGFALYLRQTGLAQSGYMIRSGVPERFGEIRLLPTVLHQKPYSAFTVYNLSGGFNSTVQQLEKSVVALFPQMKGAAGPGAAYVISNITLEYSLVGVAIVKPPNLGPALQHANITLFGAICQYYLVNPEHVYCGHLGNTPYMLYYQVVAPLGTNQYSYTVLAWSSTQIVVLQYQSTVDVSVPQLEKMVEMLLQQQL